MNKLKVLLVTSDREACGIREHGKMLQEAVGRVSAGEIEIVEFPNPDWDRIGAGDMMDYDILHLNHHAALHASWREPQVRMVKDAGWPVLVTQHDTFETLKIMKERGFPMFQEAADYVVQHEMVEGMYGPVEFIRQGVLPAAKAPAKFLTAGPRVGTVGFAFGWKGHEMLERAAVAAGWEALILKPEDGWLGREDAVALLAGCDATAFLYTTGNSGTSGAIRLGLAARKPLIALSGCRQFRDLEEDKSLGGGIHWVADEAQVAGRLKMISEGEPAGVVQSKLDLQLKLAERDSWENVAKRYILIYEHLRYRRKP